ncbi:Uncharacterized protein BM_BM13537 [Brugia malayi]|uniref:Bm13537 n=1 Tax=Brugia malayi TaxID=6279 RepID=A0A0K0IY41_BRUMA|nr:Uncharacterized protein BM_BM13537 [Brugia malayi]CDP99679.1 Bm13537 [Brugia malayi]VIO91853.1 Uncharacterized protein BM_BM13537 [Brugia malayi]
MMNSIVIEGRYRDQLQEIMSYTTILVISIAFKE